MNTILYFLTSILYILSFPNFNLSYFAWVCLIPLIIAVDKERDIWSVIRNCLFCGWVIFLGGMYWLTKVTWLGYVLITFYMAWYIVLFGIIRFYNKNFITIPLAWTALEFIRSNLGGGIPWLLLGASQYNFLSLIQISNITGVYGVSFIVALVNEQGRSLLIVALVNEQGQTHALAWVPLLMFKHGRGRSSAISSRPAGVPRYKNRGRGAPISVLILVMTLGYGKIVLNRQVPSEKLKIGIVQPNVPQDIKWDPAYTDWMLGKLEILTKKLGSVDLIIWPETAVPTLTETPGLLERVKELKTNLLLGSQGVENGRYYNSAFFISKEGRIVGEYRKIHLVPFGEFVPFGDVFPFLKKFTPIVDGFSKGNEYKVFRVSGRGTPILSGSYRVSVLICFEDIFPNLARRFVQNGADILVNITNDAWFGKTAAVYQHAYLSVFRAVENCVPLIRATNTGLSCFIDYTGKIYSLKPFVEISQAREILVPKRNTFYTRYGDVFSWLCVLTLMKRILGKSVSSRGKGILKGKT